MKPSVAIQHIVLIFSFLFFIGQKGVVTLARIKPLPDTAVICSVKGFFPFSLMIPVRLCLPGALNKNIFQFLKTWFF